MTTLEHNRSSLASPIRLYIQFVSSSRQLKVNPSCLLAHIKYLMSHSHLKAQDYQLQLLSRIVFSFLDDNKDGQLSLSDVCVLEKRILFWLAPTQNKDLLSIERSSHHRFCSISSQSPSLTYDRLFAHFKQRAPKYLPFRNLIASLLSLQLLELMSHTQSTPTRSRIIDEHSWTQFALSLSLSL